MLPPPNVNIGKFWRDWQKKDLSTALYNQQDRPTNPAAVYSVYRPSLSKIEKDAVARKRIRDRREYILKLFDADEAMRLQQNKEQERNARFLPHRMLARVARATVKSMKKRTTRAQKIAKITKKRHKLEKQRQFVPWIPTVHQKEQIERQSAKTGGRRKRKKTRRRVKRRKRSYHKRKAKKHKTSKKRLYKK